MLGDDSYQHIGEFIEPALGVPFTQKSIEDLPLTIPMVRSLIEGIYSYHDQFPRSGYLRAPVRHIGNVRVAILPSEYKVEPHRKIMPVDYMFDIVKEVKRALLWAHQCLVATSPFFEFDAAQDVRNGFRPTRVFPTEERYLNKIKRDLLELVSLEELIRRKIVIPVPMHIDRMWGHANDVINAPWSKVYHNALHLGPKEEAIVRAVSSRLADSSGFDKRTATQYSLKALIDQSVCQSAGFEFDPIFRELGPAMAYRAALLTLKTKISSANSIEPIAMHQVIANKAIDHEKVSTSDLIQIRLNEDLFETWRTIIRECAEHLDSNQGKYNDSGKEMAEYVAAQQRTWNERAEKILGQGALATFQTGAVQVVIGLAVGAFVGAAIDAAKGPLIGGVSNAVKPLYDLFAKGKKAIEGRPQRVSFDHHMLAVGAPR